MSFMFCLLVECMHMFITSEVYKRLTVIGSLQKGNTCTNSLNPANLEELVHRLVRPPDPIAPLHLLKPHGLQRKRRG